MATGSIFLSPGAALLPDGTTTNLPPAMRMVKSTGTAPAPYFLQLLFDAANEEWCSWQLRLPADFATLDAARVQYKMASATTGAVVWGTRVAAITPGDAVDVDAAKAFASSDSATSTVPGTAGHMAETTISIANADSAAAGDFIIVRLARVASDAADTATGDAEFLGLTLLYTTT